MMFNQETTRFRRDRHRQGATLVEILFTIVIFLVGILAVVQIFPKGLDILKTNRAHTVASQLAHSEIERIKGASTQLPEAILPVQYLWTGTDFVIQVDLNRRPTSFTLASQGIQTDGTYLDQDGNQLGYWPYFTGANIIRRVFGEGRTVPAPRFVPTDIGTVYGGVMALQFAPVVTDPRFQSVFQVYGNDLSRIISEGGVPAGFPVRTDYNFFVSEDGDAMVLPQGPYRSDNPTYQRSYRISFSYVYQTGAPGNTRSRDVVAIVQVPQQTPGQPRLYVPVDLLAISAPGPGETFSHLEVDTVRVQRLFDQMARATDFLSQAQVDANPNARDDAVYQYFLLDRTLGMVIFNPLGFNYQERRGRTGRVPLVARVDYDVLDWRIIRDDFRVPADPPFHQRLVLNSLKVMGNVGPDGLPYTGIGIPVPLANATLGAGDFTIVDLETGGMLMPSSYTVDKSLGLVRFVDEDADPVNGLTARILYPGNRSPSTIPDIRGRSLRALYQAQGEFSVQTVKASTIYRPTYSATLGYSQCYIGGTNLAGDGQPTRVYFSLSDIGKKVIIGEAFYRDAGNNLQVVRDQEFLITAPQAGDPLQLAYVDIRSKASDAVQFDFSNGYAVRRVRGTSVGVRVMWNPTFFEVKGTPNQNLTRLGTWQESLRRTETETFLMRGEVGQ